VDGHTAFYREAGDPSLRALVPLRGFPASPHLFRRLTEDPKGAYHLIAPRKRARPWPTTEAMAFTVSGITHLARSAGTNRTLPERPPFAACASASWCRARG
jgi:hypothetical protein